MGQLIAYPAPPAADANLAGSFSPAERAALTAIDNDLLDRVLRATLLSAQGTEFAIAPFEGLGGLLARLFTFRHRSPGDTQMGWAGNLR